MVIYDRDFGRTLLCPTENKAPLLVDPDGVKPGAITPESFKPVSGRHGEVREHAGPV